MAKTTLSGYARLHNVTRQAVYWWIHDHKIKAEHPAPGVWLIDTKQPRPKKCKPWYGVKNGR